LFPYNRKMCKASKATFLLGQLNHLLVFLFVL
jgi:hypothetical protein